MKHPHFETIMEWAADTSKVVQCRDPNRHYEWADLTLAHSPSWGESLQYRIKPTPKPDVVHKLTIDIAGTVNHPYMYYSPDVLPNVEFTFDGETGELKSVRKI